MICVQNLDCFTHEVGQKVATERDSPVEGRDGARPSLFIGGARRPAEPQMTMERLRYHAVRTTPGYPMSKPLGI